MIDNSVQLYDVCVVCALPEEVRAWLEVMQPHCEGRIETRISPQHRYEYRFATLKNTQGERLTLHLSWLSRYGPHEMTLHLSRVLEECQPRIAIMTGICAGDAQQVHLGDLVVAERTFTYDTGKFMPNEQGRSVHLHDTLTYQLDGNLLRFLGLFDDWKPLIADLERPPSSQEPHTTACHIKAMASGSAVRADHPFEDIQAPVRGAIAIDMEGAAFGLVMSRYPLTPWLVVKGVCDYADQDKNDTYHTYAARASALYALSFIQAYVTEQRMPRNSGKGPLEAAPLPSQREVQAPRSQRLVQPSQRLRFLILLMVALVLSIGIASTLTLPRFFSSGAAPTPMATKGTLTTLTPASRTPTATAHSVVPTATASIVPAEPPTLSDPLQDNSKGFQWDEGTYSDGTCGFVTGKYYLVTALANQGNGCNTEAPQGTFGNFVYQITMTILSGIDNTGSGAGPQFRVNPSQNASHYKVTFDVSGNWHLWISTNDNASILPASLAGARCGNPCPYFHTGLNQPNVFTIRDMGNNIEVWVNGSLIDSCSDSTYTSGFLGVRLDPGTNSASVAFSDLKVWRL